MVFQLTMGKKKGLDVGAESRQGGLEKKIMLGMKNGDILTRPVSQDFRRRRKVGTLKKEYEKSIFA